MAMRYIGYSRKEYGFLEFRQVIAELDEVMKLLKIQRGGEG